MGRARAEGNGDRSCEAVTAGRAARWKADALALRGATVSIPSINTFPDAARFGSGPQGQVAND